MRLACGAGRIKRERRKCDDARERNEPSRSLLRGAITGTRPNSMLSSGAPKFKIAKFNATSVRLSGGSQNTDGGQAREGAESAAQFMAEARMSSASE